MRSLLSLVRRVPRGVRRAVSFGAKISLTVGAFWLLLSHRIQDADGEWISTFEAIRRELPNIDASTFWTFCALAASIKFVGISCSITRWYVLLKAQGIRFPVWHIIGTFLIGRFLGTFLPSTIGLDAYKLWDAAHYARRTVEPTAATAFEKPIGLLGIFVSFLVAAPFGAHILGAKEGIVLAITVPVSLAVIGSVVGLLLWPRALVWFIQKVPGRSRKAHDLLERVAHAAAAYRGKIGTMLSVLGLSFGVHFTTAAMYFCTALAVGATGVTFWESTFASTVQIFATVVFPFTVGGEGIREIVHAFMLEAVMGAQKAVLAAALGFWAAEALTLFGGFFWLARRRGYHPRFVIVDGQPVAFEERTSDPGPEAAPTSERVAGVPA